MTRRLADGDGADGEPFDDLIELMFFAYRDFVEDADRVLACDGFGRAHHRVLYFVARRPGLTVAELLEILRITKQSLNRVLKDLLERGYVVSELGQTDRRQRLLTATTRGQALVREIAERQGSRFERAFASLGRNARPQARAFLEAMTDEATRSADDRGRIGLLPVSAARYDGAAAALKQPLELTLANERRAKA